LLFESKDLWEGIMAKLEALTEIYPSLEEKIEEQWEILREMIV